MNKYFFYIVTLISILCFVSCQRDDDEPIKAARPISRLYVSTSNYQANTTSPALYNVFVVTPADSNSFAIDPLSNHTSSALGGSAIHFSPYAQSIFQSSVNSPAYRDTSIYVMNVSDKGVISNGNVIGNRRFNNVKGLWYYVHNTPGNTTNITNNYLLVTNLGADTVNLFIVDQPKSRRGFTPPRYELRLNYRPWSIQMNGDDLLLSRTEDNGGIVVYKNLPAALKVDTLLDIEPTYQLTVSGANNIRGLSYSSSKDILALTDYKVNSGAPEPNVGDGRILIFENFSQYTSSGTIVPTRVITGANTLLQQPLDVALDTREGEDDALFIYVADAGPVSRNVLRFKLSDTGNVEPDEVLEILNRQTPQSISLDSRGANRL
ncbi:hypothetical protein FAZ19_05190 [Sphingobacterium alkalisoli]|uniref:Uncharacterized protein n=1 Tax=Sphingobacterium alkalisoli TaxID=1874115 RepID=A0A4U0H9Q8_9SPHI|nr:hypothetical protein [Sphingobacterium alkalisoli]TJY68653.1 hypothetical protein FAZ19_05190 [Sphingobacterium alkalisoli]GGH05034.1 hypothetical protein GCM10011418_00990 [Sphingobacterium alkalisoli]